MNKLKPVGVNGTSGAMRIPARPATIEPIIQLTAAIRSGEIPLTKAPFSVSAEARVCSPKRVNR